MRPLVVKLCKMSFSHYFQTNPQLGILTWSVSNRAEYAVRLPHSLESSDGVLGLVAVRLYKLVPFSVREFGHVPAASPGEYTAHMSRVLLTRTPPLCGNTAKVTQRTCDRSLMQTGGALLKCHG